MGRKRKNQLNGDEKISTLLPVHLIVNLMMYGMEFEHKKWNRNEGVHIRPAELRISLKESDSSLITKFTRISSFHWKRNFYGKQNCLNNR